MFIPYNSKLKELAKKNRKNPTKAEEKLWNAVLINKKLGYKFLRQKPIGNFIVDFYSSSLKMVLEVDGDDHAEKQEDDFIRTAFLERLGMKVIRYKNLDILQNISGVYEDLVEQVNLRGKEVTFLI